jgi:hypothetical protein
MQAYQKTLSIDNPLIPPTPNSLTELAEYQTRNPEADPGEWTPRASGALRRHAAAYEQFEVTDRRVAA